MCEESGESVVLKAEASINDKINKMMMIDERHGRLDEGEREWLIEVQKFMRRQQPVKHAIAKRDGVDEIVGADR